MSNIVKIVETLMHTIYDQKNILKFTHMNELKKCQKFATAATI